MSSLRPAHRGYEYQDLMVAARSVDLLLGTLKSVIADEKLVEDDRFDDLTTVDVHGCRERIQFKHTDSEGQALSLATFTSDSRDLRLDRLLASAVADRDGPGSTATALNFRVILRDSRPTIDSLLRYLKPAVNDPGPFLPAMTSFRLKFDPDVIWPNHDSIEELSEQDRSPFAFVRNTPGVNREDVVWFCERLVIEVEAPGMSGDLGSRGTAEVHLLNRVIQDIGAGQYPNAHRAPVDVAAALVNAARMARQGRIQLSDTELLRRAQLRSDFGAVSHHDPVDSALEVARPLDVADLTSIVAESAWAARLLVVEGPPGQGKSWTCKQVVDQLSDDGWLVAEHYCFLGAADHERAQRVDTDHIYGSLLHIIEDADASLVQQQRPRFAASQFTLEEAVRKSLQTKPERPVALIVDGLDHVSRVAPLLRTSDPSRQLAEELATLIMPPGSVLIVLSQPGDHLVPLLEAGAQVVQVPEFSRDETAVLVEKHGITDAETDDASSLDEVIDAIHLRAQGNTLYSTYLCRELITCGGPALATVNSLPAYNGTLEAYYEHLYQQLDDRAGWVADYLAFLDFTVTPHELGDIQPDRAHRVRDALHVLSPVIDTQPDGGLRVYHESFSRFLADRFDESTMRAINERIATWLSGKGLFTHERTYRFLFPALARAKLHFQVVQSVDRAFLANSVAAGFPASAILSNLTVAIGCAAHINDWPAVVRCIELARGASTFEYERLDTVMIEFADVAVALIGGEQIARRLLFEKRPVVPARTGLLICEALDVRSFPVPWNSYIDTFIRENATDNVSYDADSNAKVYAAILRGRLRSFAMEQARSNESTDGTSDGGAVGWVGTPESLQLLVEYIDKNSLPADKVALAVLDTQGLYGALEVALHLAEPAPFALAVSHHLHSSGRRDTAFFVKFRELASGSDRCPGSARSLLNLGAPIESIRQGSLQDRRVQLLQLTDEVQHPVNYDKGLDTWLDLCTLAAIDDPIGLAAVDAAVRGEFWYANWLRFSINLARAEAADEQYRSEMALNAIRLLNLHTEPFAGKPRACDLYRVWKQIRETIHRAVKLLDDEAWREAVNILAAMSDSISTTIDGEFGGPFAADDLLNLLVDTGASDARREVAEDLVEAIINRSSAGRFYSDLAMFRLVAARLALRCGDHVEAKRWWVEASQMLSGYGYRKDRTIFEILDPLTELITADPRRGRERVAAVQALAKRVPAHTDGRETRHARSAWWRLLALADPTALASLVTPAMVSQCNLPSAYHERARVELWRIWHLKANPVLVSLLRNTLDLTVEPEDVAGLERLLQTVQRPSGLDAQILSLADGRHSRYSDSNSAELLSRDAKRVDELNAIADRLGAPHITLWESFKDSPIEDVTPRYNAFSVGSHGDAGNLPPNFPLGVSGLAHAVRAWRRRPYDTTAPTWDVARYANAIGYRLVALIQEERHGDAELSLRSIAETDQYRFNQDLLLMIAEGLERVGHDHLAAVAYALRWTRSRASGGWLAFGGETAIESLRRALALDSDATLTLIAEETQRAANGDNLGVTQAIIYAFALAEMPAPEGATALDVAFRCWDEAASVISARAPRVHVSDDPDEPYEPSSSDDGAPYLGDLDEAFHLAIVAGVSNPGRELKRRSMLSVRMLLDYAPAAAGNTLQQLLPALSDSATLAWLLKLVESSKYRTSIVTQCEQALSDLAVSDLLTVRSLARRLLPAGTAPNLPPTPPDDTLLGRARISVDLWLPSGQRERVADSEVSKLAEDLERVAGTRIARGEAILPRFREAVLHRLKQAVDDGRISKRLDRQGAAIGRGDGLPDAYLAIEEAIEGAIQWTAAGGRLAMLANGEGALGHQWEDRLAEAILDDPFGPLELETVRHPRLAIPVPPGKDSADWIELRDHLSGNTNTSRFDHAYYVNGAEVVAGTKIHPTADCARVNGSCFNGWRIIGSEERRTITSQSYKGPRHFVLRYAGLEVRDSGDATGFEGPPLTHVDSSVWMQPVPPGAIPGPIASGKPLLGYDGRMTRYGDAVHGLGIPEKIMVPTGWLRVLCRLEPFAPYLLGDEQGSALALITWRTEYERSDYHLAWPKLRGSAIVVRPDLLHRLECEYGERLAFRDVVVGSSRMIESAAS